MPKTVVVYCSNTTCPGNDGECCKKNYIKINDCESCSKQDASEVEAELDKETRTYETGTTINCPKCKEDLLIKRPDNSMYCQTCGHEK